MDLSVVIPTFNEAKNLQVLLPKVQSVLNKLGCEYEIIIADAGSRDNTYDIVKKNKASIFIQEKKGFGAAPKEAFVKCQGDFIITMDADLSHDPYIIKQLYQHRHNAEMVIASRYIRGGYANLPFIRKILSRLLNTVFCFILDFPLKDISSGFRLYKREMLEDLKIESNGFEIQEEIVVRAYMQGYFITEIPFHYLLRRSGQSKLKPIKCALAYLKSLFKMWKIRNTILSADYDERAFYSRNPLQRYWQRRRYAIVLSFSDKSERILDLGCGSSKILEAFPQAIGMDIAFNKLRYRRRLINPLVNGDILAIPFKNYSFDELICSEVIEHVADNECIFKEFNRILKPGGILILGTPDYAKVLWNIIEKLYKYIHPSGYADEHITHYTFKSLQDKLRNYGFELIAYRYICKATLIIKAIKRWEYLS